MSLTAQVVTIALAAIATILTRFLPFMIFSEKRGTPKFVEQLGQFLPPSILGMLVIYCYKDDLLHADLTSVLAFIAGAVVVMMHVWKRNMLLSILSGTVVYIILVNFI
ncbi:branched-chain amino acid transporter permease [Lactobacillaceae bacterium Melli_B4]